MSALDSAVVVWVLRHHNPVSGRSLRMSYVLYLLLSSYGTYVVDHVGYVDTANLVPGKVPELLGGVVSRSVTIGVPVATGITQPNIKSRIGQHVDQTGLRSHQDVICR